MSHEPEIRAWSAGDPPLLAAFTELRAERESSFRPRTAVQWDWAFRANPGGTRVHAAWRGERLVALACALPVRTRVHGEERSFACLADLRLAPGEDESTLAATVAALHTAHLGPAGDLVHHGWPDERDARLLRGVEHELLRVQCVLVRALGPGPRELAPPVEERTRFDAEADVLYACCASHWSVSAIRDAVWLNWRFCANPLHGYRVLALQSADVLRGFAVYRSGAEFAPALGLLADWLVLPGDEEASAALLEGVLATARADGATALATALPEWSPWAEWLQERGFRHRPTELLHLGRSAAPRIDMLMLRDAWWSTPADAMVL
jgi:hypothetical protein